MLVAQCVHEALHRGDIVHEENACHFKHAFPYNDKGPDANDNANNAQQQLLKLFTFISFKSVWMDSVRLGAS